MHRSARLAVSGAAVLGLAAGLLAVGAAVGSPGGSSGPAAPRPAASAPVDALTGLQQAAERAPLDPARWSALGLAYVDEARRTADPSWYGRAEQALARSLELRPDDNDAALTGQAALAAARHRFADALALTDRALAVNAFSPTTHGVRADALTELGRYDEALAAAQRMLELRPAPDAYARLSYAFELRGDLERARLALEEARDGATAPGDRAFASHYLGELALGQGRVADARAAYADALAADPSSLPPQAGLARVQAAEGDLDGAVEALRRVVATSPQPASLTELGELLEVSGRPDLAEEQYAVVRALQQAFAAEGADVDSELALFEADHGDPETAVRLARQAYDARPDALLVQDAYAWALRAAGRPAEALPVARQVLRLGTRSPALLARVGLVEAAAGDPTAARAHLTEAVALAPALPPLLAREARDVLATLP